MLRVDRRPIRVRVVSDEPALPGLLASVLGSEFQLLEASRERSAEDLSGDADVVILDYDPSGRPGTLWKRLLGNNTGTPDVPVVLLVKDENRLEALDLVERGAYGCVRKPPVVADLRAMLRSASDSRELVVARRQLDSLKRLDQLTGASVPMQMVYKLVRKVANLDASVLITGESGTGKELIARAIHNTGTRAKRPFVAVSCGAIPETLIEAELFGHEKGAFTGAPGTREGYLERAGDGTLFLDEIGELKPNIQVKLLRVLQQREFSRLGSSRSIPLRARVVLATHRDLGRMVAEGDFRQDLFYRINVMNIEAPPLRDHSEDIPQLVQHFLRQYADTFRKPVEAIEPEALMLLESYSWPGNVRELENVIQRAIIMAEGDSIQVSDLPETIRELDTPALDDGAAPSGSFERLLRAYKVKLAMDAVQQCNGNKTLAAQTLSISRAYLHRLIRHASEDPTVADIGAFAIASERSSALALASGA